MITIIIILGKLLIVHFLRNLSVIEIKPPFYVVAPFCLGVFAIFILFEQVQMEYNKTKKAF